MVEEVVVFTHDDLDGAMCGFLFEYVLGKRYKVTVYYCDIAEIDDKFRAYLDEVHNDNVKHIFMTDIALRSEELIQKVEDELKDIFQLIDHHQSVAWMNKYTWATVQVYHDEVKGFKSCGASLVLDKLLSWNEWLQLPFQIRLNIAQMVSDVRDVDIWDWEEHSNRRAKQLNDLFLYYGLEEFREWVIGQDFDIRWTIEDRVRVETITKVNDDYILARVKSTIGDDGEPSVITLAGKDLILVTAESSFSMIGQELSKKFPNYEGVCVVNFHGKSVGFYSHRNDVDLTTVAMAFGGGGHPMACGCRLNEDLAKTIIEKMFN